MCRQAQRGHRLAAVQALAHLFQNGQQRLRFLVAGVGNTAVAVEDAIGGLQVCERQLDIDYLDVVYRRNAPSHMYDVGVGEAAHNVRDGVGLAHVRQELIAEALAL